MDIWIAKFQATLHPSKYPQHRSHVGRRAWCLPIDPLSNRHVISIEMSRSRVTRWVHRYQCLLVSCPKEESFQIGRFFLLVKVERWLTCTRARSVGLRTHRRVLLGDQSRSTYMRSMWAMGITMQTLEASWTHTFERRSLVTRQGVWSVGHDCFDIRSRR